MHSFAQCTAACCATARRARPRGRHPVPALRRCVCPPLLPHPAPLQADDVPDDAEEAEGEADLVLEGSQSIAEQQHGEAPQQA